jgi:signal transduction histidine kinase
MIRLSRGRILFTWGVAMAILILGGGGLFYLALTDRYREDHDHELEETIEAAAMLYRVDRADYPTGPATIAHVMSELTTPDRTLAAYDAEGLRIAITRSSRTAPDLSHVDPFTIGLAPVSRAIAGHDVRLMRTALPDSLWLVVGVSDTTYLERIRFLRLLLATGLPLLLLAGSGLGVMVMRPLLAAERAVLEEQRRFLADAAHELRTPVAVLQSELDAARAEGNDPAAQRGAVQAIERETTRLARLVDDLLVLARAEAMPAPQLQSVFLDDVAHRALGRVQRLPVAAGRRIALGTFDATAVRGDPILLERALVILLENALLHGGPGDVTLEVATTGNRARASVRDTGPGVPPDARERIFERFGRIGQADGGAGLGLPIAQQIVAQHGGTLSVEDAHPGARFIITLPLAPAR